MHSILIVDDDKTLCQVLQEELEEIGFNAFYATGADEAFEFLEKQEAKIELMLLDLKMPEKDGFYVLHNLVEKGIELKVIVLTAYADLKSVIESTRLGAKDFVSKPYDLDELLISIRKVLQQD